MKRLAVLLSGIHYKLGHSACFVKKDIDYRYSFQNIKTQIYDYFDKKYIIDTFICTNESTVLDSLINKYSPVEYSVCSEGRNKKIVKVLELMINYSNNTNTKYDFVVWTRFDIKYLKKFTEFNLHEDKLNIMSILQGPALICDNFYAFPGNYIDDFYEIYKNVDKYGKPHCDFSQHGLKKVFEERFMVNYIYNEYATVSGLSSYKISDLNVRDFILNDLSSHSDFGMLKNTYETNLKYCNRNKCCTLDVSDDGVVHLKKNVINMCFYVWFGYNILLSGKYNLSFSILSDKIIKQQNNIGVKLHNPIRLYDDFLCKIVPDEWCDVVIDEITINAKDLLIFIFDGFDGELNVKIKNIRLIPI